MNRNVGSTDRIARIVAGAVLGAVSLGILAGGTSLPTLLSPVLGVVALVLLATAATRTCGLYAVLGLDTS